jgi:hypothetical protein
MKALLIVALTVATLRATPSDATPTVQYAGGRITVDLRDADLAEVIGEITTQAKLEVRGTPTTQRLSIRLEAVPLVDALSRLLQGQSFVLTYDSAGGLKGVRFLAASTAPWRAAVPDTTASTPEVEPSTSLPPTKRPVQVDGLLATALGAEVSDFTTIMAVALMSGDARLRAEALRVALGLFEADSDLRDEVMQMLDGLDDAYIAKWLTEVARDDPGEVARQTARAMRFGPLRRRAAAVSRLLPSSRRTN